VSMREENEVQHSRPYKGLRQYFLNLILGKGQTIPNRNRSARPGIECTPGEDLSMSDTIIPGIILKK
jgi:hypothetical protein